MTEDTLRIGFIPLVDAAALIVAADMGFAAREGLNIELVREVSWSNVRDKLNIGLFDAAHLLAPLAIASSLGVGHIKVPLLAPFMLGLNGNAITVSPGLYDALTAAAQGDLGEPLVSARALARVVAERRRLGAEPLRFGMTFPFSTHNYQIRLWMAAGGVDPDEDVRLVVLPPPYMVDSLSSRQVDGFCVGAPWNSVAVELGVGHILHLGCDIVAPTPEKVLAVRAAWAENSPDVLRRLLRALAGAVAHIDDPAHHAAVAAHLAAPHRLNTAPDIIGRTLGGQVRTALDGSSRSRADYIVLGRHGSARPDPMHAAWLYAQMVRWHQAPLTSKLLAAAQACFRPDVFDGAIGTGARVGGRLPDQIRAFAGPAFDGDDVAAYVAAWQLPSS